MCLKIIEKGICKMEGKKTQTNEVLNYLQTHKSITSIEAIEMFGATRLSAIIFNLRNRGYQIITTTETKVNRYGRPCSYARYSLCDGE